MATNESLRNQLTEKPQEQITPGRLGLEALTNTPTMRKRFEEVLHDNANAFMSNIMTLVSNNSHLVDSEPMSIMSGALTAAALNLGLDKNLGYVYLVPLSSKSRQTGKQGEKAQFMLGYKGYIRLAQRSGKYRALNVIEAYEGELESWNRLTKEFEFDPNGKASDEVIGYVDYFELLNGFRKAVYWTKQEIKAHRTANNRDHDKAKLSGMWASNYNAMARKTVSRNLLSKWGILSTEMQGTTTSDEGVQRVQGDGSVTAETEVEGDIPERKEAEVISEENEDVQTGLFDASNPPLNR